jgi:hypothetical protein
MERSDLRREIDRNVREARIAAVVSIVGLVLAAVALAMRLLPLMWE